MPQLDLSIQIQAPVNKVFDFHRDIRKSVQFVGEDTEVKVIGDNTQVFEGATLKLLMELPMLGEQEWESKIIEFRDNELIVEEAVTSPFKSYTIHLHFDSESSGSTQLLHVINFELPFFMKPMESKAIEFLEDLGLKRLQKTKEALEKSGG